jgi:plastocyanin
VSPTPGVVNSTIQSFTLRNLTIPVGTTVTWVNRDGVGHTATSGTPGSPSYIWNSGALGSSGTYSFTFTEVGTFDYFCEFHPSMTATVTVTGP